mmetsp:Transcript_5030/g.15525  ORF Transcript_5030/g.15525 Transcript_5030/m.15525 type:complete len:234 (-) Transcript_5030:730-1431(-)
MTAMKSSTCLDSSSILKVWIFAMKSRLKSARIFASCWAKASGSTALPSGATRASRWRNCSCRRSRCLKSSTFTKASRRCTALPLLSLKASTKFLMAFSKVAGEISTPKGVEGFGKPPLRKKLLVNSSRSCEKSLEISSKSPLKAGSSTANPGCGRPKQPTERKVCRNLSAVSLRPSTSEFIMSRRCRCMVSRQSSKLDPASYQAQSRTRNSKWPKGAPSLAKPVQAASAKVVK